MKNALIYLVVILLLTGISSASENDFNTIEVSGVSEIYVAPDEAVINMGIKCWDSDMDEARQKFHDNSQKLKNLLVKYSIEDKYIKTDLILIEPTYKNFEKKYYESDIVSGYRFSKRVSVIIKDINKVEEILSEIIYSGATNLYGVDYNVSDHRQHKDEARKLSIISAKEKAVLLASQLGQTVGKAIKIIEPNYGNLWGRQANVMQMGAQAEVGPDVQPGMIKISATVNVIFELL